MDKYYIQADKESKSIFDCVTSCSASSDQSFGKGPLDTLLKIIIASKSKIFRENIGRAGVTNQEFLLFCPTLWTYK